MAGTRKTESLRKPKRRRLPTKPEKETKVMKFLMIPHNHVVCAPVDDDGGAGGHFDDDDNREDIDDDDDAADDDDADDDEGDDDDAAGDDDDGDLGRGAQKRIRGLNEQVKALKQELETAKKLSGDDGKAILAAAEASGILPGLMTKEEADAFGKLQQIPNVIETYDDWLDEHGQDDELEIGNGETMTYGQVKKRVRQLRTQLSDLKDKYGERRNELHAQVRNIFELGLKAVKAGWKGEGEKKVRKTKKKIEDRPTSTARPKTKAARNPDDFDVTDEESFESFVIAENRKAKRK
jgi:hypothetical protein